MKLLKATPQAAVGVFFLALPGSDRSGRFGTDSQRAVGCESAFFFRAETFPAKNVSLLSWVFFGLNPQGSVSFFFPCGLGIADSGKHAALVLPCILGRMLPADALPVGWKIPLGFGVRYGVEAAQRDPLPTGGFPAGRVSGAARNMGTAGAPLARRHRDVSLCHQLSPSAAPRSACCPTAMS